MVFRRAKRSLVIEAIPAWIFPDEVIVGLQASRPRGNSVSRLSGRRLVRSRVRDPLRRGSGTSSRSRTKSWRQLEEEIFPYWKGTGRYEKTVDGRIAQMLAAYPETNESSMPIRAHTRRSAPG